MDRVLAERVPHRRGAIDADPVLFVEENLVLLDPGLVRTIRQTDAVLGVRDIRALG